MENGARMDACTRCRFVDNRAIGRGGALYMWTAGTKMGECVDCVFEGNQAHVSGGAVYMENGARMDSCTRCRFVDNRATGGRGGALYMLNLGTRMGECTDCVFEDNGSEQTGGAVYIDEAKMESCMGCRFVNNVADDVLTVFWSTLDVCCNMLNVQGGAFYMRSSKAQCTDCLFQTNKAKGGCQGCNGYGGAMHLDGSSMTCVSSNFTENGGISRGGAVYATGGSDLHFIQSRFLNNKALEFNGYYNNVREGIAVYSLGSLVECHTCDFVSSQPGATTLHLVGSRLQLKGEIKFAASSGPAFVRTDSKNVASIVIKGGKVTVWGAPRMVQWPSAPPSDCSGRIVSVDPSLNGAVEIDNCAQLQNPAGPPAIAIKSDSVLSKVELSHANLFLADSTGPFEGSWPQLALTGALESDKSTIQVEKAGDIQIKSAGIVEWKASNFTGLGTISIRAGATVSRVSKCSFGEGVMWHFEDISKTAVKTWRNNDGNVPSVNLSIGGSFQCDRAETGQLAGCDARATCTNEPMGGVRCDCIGRVTEASSSTETGIVCSQRAASSAFFRSKRVVVAVRKPMDASQPFQVAAEGEKPTYIAVHSNTTFIAVHGPTRNIALSPAKSRNEKEFVASILGNKTNWHDSTTETAVLSVQAGILPRQTVQIVVDLKPFPSCQYTTGFLSDLKKSVNHLDGVYGTVMPRDTDGFLITKTQFRFHVHLQYGHESLQGKTVQATNREAMKSFPVANKELTRAGKYSMAIELLDGWDHHAWTHGPCIVVNQSFVVVCAMGYRPDASKECVRESRESICEETRVWYDSQQVESTKVGYRKDSVLRVETMDPEAEQFGLSLVPKTKQTQLKRGCTHLPLNLIGEFDLTISDIRTNKSCSKLRGIEVTMQCDPKKNEAMTADGSCVKAAIKASIESKSLQVELNKPNPHLHMKSDNLATIIRVEPSAKYPLNWTSDLIHVIGGKNWVRMGNTTELDKYTWTTPLLLDSTDIKDSTKLTAQLNLTGKSDNVLAYPAQVLISGVVHATPSLTKSIFKIPKEITQGQKVTMSILAKDDDGLSITKDRGRFFKIMLEGPSGHEFSQNTLFREGLFIAEFSSVELSEVGEYSVYVEKVFDLTVKPTVRALSLPTKSHRLQFEVVSGGLKRMVGGLIGGVAGASLLSAGYYARKNRGKVSQILVSFLMREVLLMVGVVLELMDYTSDAIVFSEVLSRGAEHSETEPFVLPYMIAFSIASLVSAISLVMKVKLYVKQVRKRRADANPLWLEISATFSKCQQKVVMLNSKLQDTKKVIVLVWVNVLLACCEDVPMVILTFLYIQRLGTPKSLGGLAMPPTTAALLSMLMSAGAIYFKLGKLLLYKGLLEQKNDLNKRLQHNVHKLTSQEQDSVRCWPELPKSNKGLEGTMAPEYCGQSEKDYCECRAAVVPEEPSSRQPCNDSEETAVANRGRAGSVEMLSLDPAQRPC